MAENDDDARVCVACGHPLVEDDTVPAAFDTRPTEFLPGSLWLDDLRQGGRIDDDLRITLRDVQARAPLRPLARSPLPPSPGFPLEAELPVLPELNEAIAAPPLPELQDPLPAPDEAPGAAPGAPAARLAPLPLPPLPRRLPPVPVPEIPPPPPEPEVELTPEQKAARDALEAKRAARRASVRRSRLRQLARAQPEAAEILVVDRHDIDRGVLCGLLQAFGFVTHSLGDPALAVHLLAAHPFAAVFTDIPLDASDGGDGIELARAVKAAPRPMLLVLVTHPLSTIDRVRAGLAGFDDVLTKPCTRGDVARVLDVHGIALPADARRT